MLLPTPKHREQKKMNKNMKHWLIASMAVLASLPLLAHVDSHKKQQTKNVQIDSFDWQGDIPASRAVILKNPYGSIRSRNQTGEQVWVHATYQLIGENALKPEFDIREEAGFLVIEVVYSGSIKHKDGSLRARTDVSILFPDTVSIYAETDSGMIKIDKTASHVEAVSNSGHIKLTTTGLFSAKTNSGKISLRLRGQKALGESRAFSQTGEIKATVFNDMGIELESSTKGKHLINGKEQSESHVLKLGSLASKMNFSSVTGNVSIDVIAPPELVKSVQPANVTSVDVDLRNLPKSKLWKPGDPIFDINAKKNSRSQKKDSNL
jgi:hypothetical protein